MSFAFVGAPLDRAEHLRNAPSALAALWPQARLLLLDADGNALTAADDALLVVEGGAVAGALPEDAVFLGLHGERGWFMLPAERAEVEAEGRINLRAAAALWRYAKPRPLPRRGRCCTGARGTGSAAPAAARWPSPEPAGSATARPATLSTIRVLIRR